MTRVTRPTCWLARAWGVDLGRQAGRMDDASVCLLACMAASAIAWQDGEVKWMGDLAGLAS